ncbi:LysR substrate-binding domain-containing protein [Cupriavidus necator]|uniref:LysR substrate-binding domain-containing protein n=1 Tax=Cupriavidus necator TaxID=106590 RepID=UPI003F737A87
MNAKLEKIVGCAEILAAHEWILHDLRIIDDGSAVQHAGVLPDRGLGELAIPVDGAFSSNESHALIAWAKAGKGITRQPDWLVEQDLLSGGLIRLLEEYDEIGASEQPGIYAVFPKPRNHPRKVEAFVKFFSQKIASASHQ